MEAEFSSAVEEYHQSEEELAALNDEIDVLEREVQALRAGIAEREGKVAELARQRYLGNGVSMFGALLGTEGELDDARRRLGYLDGAQRAQASLLQGFHADRKTLDTQHALLAETKADAEQVKADIAEQRDDLEQRVATQADEIEELQAAIEAAEQAERERLAREQAARELAAAEEAAREQAAQEQAAREQAAREQADREQADREQADREQDNQDRADRVASADSSSRSQPPADPPPPPAPSPSPTKAPAPPPPPPPPAPSNAADAAVQAAMSRIGRPYQWGGNGPDVFDCSGLTSWAWRQAGVTIPRTSRSQYAGLPKVARADLRPGDLLFFNNPISHVGMYIGNGQMVEAPYTGKNVRTRSINRSGYVGAVRPGS